MQINGSEFRRPSDIFTKTCTRRASYLRYLNLILALIVTLALLNCKTAIAVSQLKPHDPLDSTIVAPIEAPTPKNSDKKPSKKLNGLIQEPANFIIDDAIPDEIATVTNT